MTGSSLLKKLSIFCYILAIAGIIIGIIAINTNLGDTLFQGYMKNYQIQPTAGVDAKTIAGISFIMSCVFTLFEGWLLGRAAKDGRKTTFLIILLILGIISPIIEIFSAGLNSILNMESIANIIAILFKAFILNQTIKVRKEALDD